ncbi:hypothetical protein PITCH_A1710011 [uncultured Desulfobacterium sp.]|uniref:Uncharacterized protein n=1 Tax=uncultured Desulfobacterium sp. TaxID=201089 RepID=A0A445MUT4_9BACT|nr:hypothetical protein PITCH_A1710011 [uncultured Desulfobacterium sp.]
MLLDDTPRKTEDKNKLSYPRNMSSVSEQKVPTMK